MLYTPMVFDGAVVGRRGLAGTPKGIERAGGFVATNSRQ